MNRTKAFEDAEVARAWELSNKSLPIEKFARLLKRDLRTLRNMGFPRIRISKPKP